MTRAVHPPLSRCLRADGVAFAANRGDKFRFSSRWQEWANVARLLAISGDFQSMAAYRLRTALLNARVPVLPTLLHRFCIMYSHLRIDDEVVIEPGVYVPHGTVTLRGRTTIGSGCVLTPWVEAGPRNRGEDGPDVGPGVFFGSLCRVVGPIQVGRAAQIGSGALVEADVPANSIVAGVPARIIATDVPGRLELEAQARERAL